MLRHLGTQTDATSVNLCLKCTKIRLAAGLCPDPLGSLSAPPDLLAAIEGVLLLRGGRGGKGMRKEREGKEKERMGKEGREGTGGEGMEGEGKGGKGGKEEGRDVAP